MTQSLSIVQALQRKDGLERSAFVEAWKAHCARLTALPLPQACAAVILYPRAGDDYSARPDEAHDGFLIVRLDGEAALTADFLTMLEGWRGGQGEYCDTARSPAILCRGPHRLIQADSEHPVRLVALMARQRGTTAEFFRSYWRDEYAPIFLGMPVLTDRFARYEQYHRLDSCYIGQPETDFDGFAVEWFASQRAFDEHGQCSEYLSTLAPLAPRFMDKPRNIRIMAAEPIVLRGGL